jgi:hypothetical protein
MPFKEVTYFRENQTDLAGNQTTAADYRIIGRAMRAGIISYSPYRTSHNTNRIAWNALTW